MVEDSFGFLMIFLPTVLVAILFGKYMKKVYLKEKSSSIFTSIVCSIHLKNGNNELGWLTNKGPFGFTTML